MRNKELLKQACLERIKLDEYKEKVEASRKIISETLKNNSPCYISYSGGKDSTCVLHLVLQQTPDILVLNWDYGRYYMPREIQEEIIENARKIGATNIRVETSEKYEIYKRRAINVLGIDYLGKLVPELYREGYRYCFLGLRKEESYKRRRRIINEKFLTKIIEVSPIADWTWLDVWTYIWENNIPYLKYYDIYGEVIGYENVRLVTFFDPEFDKFGETNIDGVLNWKFRHIEKEGC